MNFVHALVEVNAIVLYLGYTHVGTGGEAVVLLCNLADGGNLAEAQHVLVLALGAELRGEPLTLACRFQEAFGIGDEVVLLALHLLLRLAVGSGNGFLGSLLYGGEFSLALLEGLAGDLLLSFEEHEERNNMEGKRSAFFILPTLLIRNAVLFAVIFKFLVILEDFVTTIYKT